MQNGALAAFGTALSVSSGLEAHTCCPHTNAGVAGPRRAAPGLVGLISAGSAARRPGNRWHAQGQRWSPHMLLSGPRRSPGIAWKPKGSRSSGAGGRWAWPAGAAPDSRRPRQIFRHRPRATAAAAPAPPSSPFLHHPSARPHPSTANQWAGWQWTPGGVLCTPPRARTQSARSAKLTTRPLPAPPACRSLRPPARRPWCCRTACAGWRCAA